MLSSRKLLLACILSVPALFAVLGVAFARDAAHVAAATLRFQEAQSLRQAYSALAAGNHDYNGHRAKAMEELKAALKILDGVVLKNGTAQQKTATTQGQTAVQNAQKGASQTSTVHEDQASSDKLLQQAAQILGPVQASMVAHKQQPKVLARVNAAINEINTALKIR